MTSPEPTASIQLLTEATVRLLAAGEVIDSLASVVRELVDNALDAGADRIRVALWPEQWRIQVQDNGRGIARADLDLVGRSHATSKLRTIEDLLRLDTFGFRGEGLHSIAVVADLDILTCPVQAANGIRARYDGEGRLAASELCAAAPGTVVTVHELFARQPVRRRFLADRRAQVRACTQLLHRYALAHPGHLWELTVEGRTVLQLWPAVSLGERMLQLLSGQDAHDLREVTLVHEGRKLHLAMGLPDRCSRARADWLSVFINGRYVRHGELEVAIRLGFERTLRRGRHPVCIVHLTLDASEVDWNRHPAKLEVHLADTRSVAALIVEGIAGGLREFAPRPAPSLLHLAEANTSYDAGEPGRSLLRAVTQMQRTYILAEYPGGLCLVEQHVAHERVLFEALESSCQAVAVDPPLCLELTPTQAENLMTQGLTLEAFGNRTWLVRTVPGLLFGREDCLEGLREMADCEDLAEMRATLACRTAIRNGQPLEPAKMQELIDRWQRTRNPHTCPHGRPIYMPLTDNELARFFRRRWHICGS